MTSSTEKIVYELLFELPNVLRLKILGNQEILEKYQNVRQGPIYVSGCCENMKSVSKINGYVN